MRMVSGIAWDEQWDDHSDATAMLFAAPDTAAFVGAHAQAQAPGSHWQYSSGNYQLLQHMLRCGPPVTSGPGGHVCNFAD